MDPIFIKKNHYCSDKTEEIPRFANDRFLGSIKKVVDYVLRVAGCGFKKGLAPDWGLMIDDW